MSKYTITEDFKAGDEIEIVEIDGKQVIRKVQEDIFDLKYGEDYYFINENGEVRGYGSDDDFVDEKLVKNYNACKDKEYMQTLAKKQLLQRMMEQFARQNDPLYGKLDWEDSGVPKYHIYHSNDDECWTINYYTIYRTVNTTCFSTLDIAQRCLDEVIEPFIKENPEVMR